MTSDALKTLLKKKKLVEESLKQAKTWTIWSVGENPTMSIGETFSIAKTKWKVVSFSSKNGFVDYNLEKVGAQK
jgi:hypothetical protein